MGCFRSGLRVWGYGDVLGLSCGVWGVECVVWGVGEGWDVVSGVDSLSMWCGDVVAVGGEMEVDGPHALVWNF